MSQRPRLLASAVALTGWCALGLQLVLTLQLAIANGHDFEAN